MADDFVSVEAPVDAGTDAGFDAGGDFEGDAGSTGSEQEGSVAEPAAESEPSGDQKDFRPLENGKLTQAGRQVLEKLKAENPQVAKAVQRALFMEDRLRREIPGGFKEVQELRQRVEQLGGETGIQEIQAEMDGWRGFDEMYTAGDPKVLEFLTETPEAQAAFLKIAPAAFDRFREAHPDGYNAYMTQVFAADLQENQIPLMLERLAWLAKDNPEIMDLQQRLANYVSRIGQLSRKPVTAPAAASPAKPDARIAELEQREQQFVRKEWAGEAQQKHSTLFNQEWRKQIGDRKLSDTQAAAIRELYGLKLGAILKAKPDFNQNLEKYFKAGQKDGFLKLHNTTYAEAVPRALRAAINSMGVGAKPGPKGTEGKPGSPGAAKPIKPTNGTVNAGFTFVAQKPEMSTVNNRATTPEMWTAGRAILRDGKRVYWRK